MVSTYFWMFCEGLYLFVVLYKTFVSEGSVKVCLIIIGWVVPLALIVIYAITRAELGSATDPGR